MIDFDFIAELEGRGVTKGYIPKDKKGNIIDSSGVTIATGLDLGQQSEKTIRGMKLEKYLSIFTPYLGLKKEDADIALKKKPLQITSQDAEEIDKGVKSYYLGKVILSYNRAARKALSPIQNFTLLPTPIQTVLFSLYYNLGELSIKAPNTWNSVIENNWQNLYNNLTHFGHRNQGLTNRRLKEAKYLLDNFLNKQDVIKTTNSIIISKK